MSDERRYSDDEVAAIFEAASTSPDTHREEALSRQNGLTLAELQSIGQEVGLSPERIAHAAASLERTPPPLPRRTDFGMPVSAAHVVEIPRPLTDREWSVLVADLRETFGARGKESSDGVTRTWWNSNLHAVVEPTRDGYRLRLATLKGDGPAMNRAGMFMLAMAAVVGISMPGDPGGVAGLVALGMMGTGALAMNALRLPRWARLREQQMKEIASRTLALLGPTP